MDKIYEFDYAILDAIQKIHTPALNVILMVITHMGEAGLVWVLLSIVFMATKKHRRMGVTLGSSLIMMLIVNEGIIKHLVMRERPFVSRPEIDTIISHPGSTSFPSGHSCAAFAAATSIFLFNKKMGCAAYVLAAAIVFSRLYFYVHFPTDVICGSVIGVIIAVSCYFIVKALWSRLEHFKFFKNAE